MLDVSIVTVESNLQELVDEINWASWDHANDMSEYDVTSLTAYLTRQDTLFVTCHDVQDEARVLLGMASARVELKPYGHERWLYVDEVDVCADQRRRDAGKAMMVKLIELAREAGCEEVWLGAEKDNLAANALYESLNPADVAQVVGYAYTVID